jgi:eukaryotic-like serine/threonine-protein kinase
VKRLVLLLAILLLVVSVTACAPQSSGSGEGDGLHSIVPTVVGLDETEARSAIEDAGYTVGDVSVVAMPEAEPGTVVEQDPIASTSLPREAEVDIVIAGP